LLVTLVSNEFPEFGLVALRPNPKQVWFRFC
jgi:hypothetical protein